MGSLPVAPLPAALQVSFRLAWENARRAWPGVDVSAEAFERHLLERAADRVAQEGLMSTALDDLYLACGCVLGQAKAFAAVDGCFVSHVPEYVAHLRLPRDESLELQQAVRERLFVGTTGQDGVLREYSGAGPLGAFVRIVAVRLALMRRRAKVSEQRLASVAGVNQPPWKDPTLELAAKRFGRTFAVAVEAAINQLTREERRVLRMHFFEHATLDELALVYQVHRATIARWIARARERVMHETRIALAAHAPGEEEKLLELVESQFDLSLHRLLQSRPP
jgi:RNA polymerase sigma-70 factor, ECF subfamily